MMSAQKCDVVVAGGGIAGCFAAIAAASAGAKVTIVERGDTVGGIVVDGPLEALMTFHDDDGLIATKLTREFIDRLTQSGGARGFVSDTVGYCKTIVPYDPEIVKYLLFEMLEEKGIGLELNSLVVGTHREGRRIQNIQVANKEGFAIIKADSFIDATGDGDLAYHTGAPTMMGRQEDGKVQPMTTLFQVSGVDRHALMSFICANRSQFKMDWKLIDENPETPLHIWGFGDILAQGYQEGKLSLLRSELQAMESLRPDVFVINYTRYFGNPLSSEGLARAQMATVHQVHELVGYLKDSLPGFSSAYVSRVGKLGVRESRRIVGKYILEQDDIVHAKDFADAIALGAFPIDIHQPDGNSLSCVAITKAYPIPAGCLISKDIDNLFMCGRCISATHEAIASARISATAMATGQAAGTIAAVYSQDIGASFAKILEKAEEIGATTF